MIFSPRSRLEVCSSLAEGGLTPSTGLVRSDCLHYRHLHLVCITITNLQHNSIIVILVLNRVITENVAIPAFAMLRPRGGDFVYTKLEQEVCNTQNLHQPYVSLSDQVMKRDIESLIECGARVAFS